MNVVDVKQSSKIHPKYQTIIMNRDAGSVAAIATDPVLSRLGIDPNAPPQSVALKWIDAMRSAISAPPQSHDKGFKEALILRHLTVDRVDTGLVLCTLAVKPPITNRYNTLHGGAVATIASIVGLAAVKTVAADKDFVQTEMSMSYLSAGRIGDAIDMKRVPKSSCSKLGRKYALLEKQKCTFSIVQLASGETRP